MEIAENISNPYYILGQKLPNQPLVSIIGSKAMVVTPIAGYAGSVKENMGLEDYQVEIAGIVTENFEETWQLLRKINETNKQVSCQGRRFERFNITQLAILGVEFPNEIGQGEVYSYRIRALSDADPSLIIRDAVL